MVLKHSRSSNLRKENSSVGLGGSTGGSFSLRLSFRNLEKQFKESGTDGVLESSTENASWKEIIASRECTKESFLTGNAGNSFSQIVSRSLQNLQKKPTTKEQNPESSVSNSTWEENIAPQALRDDECENDSNLRSKSIGSSLRAMKRNPNLEGGYRSSRHNAGHSLSTEAKKALMKDLKGPCSFLNELADIEDSHGVKECRGGDAENENFDEMPISTMESSMVTDVAQTSRLVL